MSTIPGNTPISQPLISPFNVLLDRIAQELDDAELVRLTFLCSEYITQQEKQRIEVPLHLLEKLVKKGKIGEEDTEFLKEILQRIERIDLVEQIEGYKGTHGSNIRKEKNLAASIGEQSAHFDTPRDGKVVSNPTDSTTTAGHSNIEGTEHGYGSGEQDECLTFVKVPAEPIVPSDTGTGATVEDSGTTKEIPEGPASTNSEVTECRVSPYLPCSLTNANIPENLDTSYSATDLSEGSTGGTPGEMKGSTIDDTTSHSVTGVNVPPTWKKHGSPESTKKVIANTVTHMKTKLDGHEDEKVRHNTAFQKSYGPELESNIYALPVKGEMASNIIGTPPLVPADTKEDSNTYPAHQTYAAEEDISLQKSQLQPMDDLQVDYPSDSDSDSESDLVHSDGIQKPNDPQTGKQEQSESITRTGIPSPETDNVSKTVDSQGLSEEANTVFNNGNEWAPAENFEGMQDKNEKQQEFQLYDYQTELIQPALQGKNCIIHAVTGSGKTVCAAAICKKQRDAAIAAGKTYKALFLVPRRILVDQQCKEFEKFFPEGDVLGAKNDVDSKLEELFKIHDIIFLTAQILVNAFKKKKLSVSQINTLILDECHHTQKNHAYNNCMRHYLKAKMDSPTKPLPMIIGLTASLGTGKKQETVLHFAEILGNMDCFFISRVRDPKNMKEFMDKNPKPKEDQIREVCGRKDDRFAQIILKIMQEIENGIKITVKNCPRGSQKYENWAVEKRKDAEKADCAEEITSFEALNVLNTALIWYDELRGKDALAWLEVFYKNLPANELNRKIFLGRYEGYREMLQNLADMETSADNPMLQELWMILQRQYEVSPQHKGIIITRTRASTHGLVQFIQSQSQLKVSVKPARISGQQTGKYAGMTEIEQDEIVKGFRGGRYNLLVSTDLLQEGIDLPKCGFVIRYNHISNEIADVQARGRARAKDSQVYIIVKQGSANHKKLFENLQKEHIMNLTMEDPRLNTTDFLDDIKKKQAEELQKFVKAEKDKAAVKQKKHDPDKYTIHCLFCGIFFCDADSMRQKESNFLCIDPDFQDRVQVIEDPKPKIFSEDIHIGTLQCQNPECKREVGILIVYKDGDDNGMHLSPKGIKFKNKENNKFEKSFAKWKQAPCWIAEYE